MKNVALSAINYLGVSSLPMRVLKKRYADQGSTFIRVNGVDVHYKIEGQGPTLVLLHGFGASLHTWDGWVKELSDRYRIVRIDLPTFGLSGHSLESTLSIDTLVDFLGAVVDRIGLGTFSLGGSSMGGYVAWRFAAQNPGRVERLVLVSAGGYPADLPWAMRAMQLPLIDQIFPRLAPRFLVEMNLRQAYGDTSKLDAETVRRYHDMMLRAGRRRALCRALSAPPAAQPAGIRDVKAPTLVLWGTLDRLVPPSHADRFARDLPCAKLVKYEGVGHVVMEEIPEQSARDVHAFLSGAADPG